MLRLSWLSACVLSVAFVGCTPTPDVEVGNPEENSQEALTNEIESSGISAEDYAKGMSPDAAAPADTAETTDAAAPAEGDAAPADDAKEE